MITGTYVLPIDAHVGHISVSATFTHTDRTLANYIDRIATVAVRGQIVPTPANVQDLSYIAAINLLNLDLSWRGIYGLPVDVSLFATNVTNLKYNNYTGGLFQGLHLETASLGEPRMIGARLRYRFAN